LGACVVTGSSITGQSPQYTSIPQPLLIHSPQPAPRDSHVAGAQLQAPSSQKLLAKSVQAPQEPVHPSLPQVLPAQFGIQISAALINADSQEPVVSLHEASGKQLDCSLQTAFSHCAGVQASTGSQRLSKSVQIPVLVSGLNEQTWQPVQVAAFATHTPVLAQKPQSPKHFS
jgi:hypothetical protein